jgi:hypothetical protein
VACLSSTKAEPDNSQRKAPGKASQRHILRVPALEHGSPFRPYALQHGVGLDQVEQEPGHALVCVAETRLSTESAGYPRVPDGGEEHPKSNPSAVQRMDVRVVAKVMEGIMKRWSAL